MIDHSQIEKDPTHANDPEEQFESQEIQDKEILELALERFKVAKDYWAPIFSRVKEDMQFSFGKQWSPDKEKARESENRSTLTYNKCLGAIRYVENNARANPPGIEIHPTSDGANSNTAKVLKGIVRSIEHRSHAKQAYIHALRCALSGGIGFWRVLPKRKYGKTDICIDMVRDPCSILIDPDAEEPGLVDAAYMFVVKNVPRRTFARMYPDANTAAIAPQHKDWYGADSVQVVEYWVREEDDNGDCAVAQFLLTAEDILDRNQDYPGKHIPIIFLPGQEVCIDGDCDYRSMTRDVIDMQRMLNYSKSEQADQLAGATRAPWLVEAAMIQNYQAIWNNANTANLPYLPYESKNGEKPFRIDPPQPPAALLSAAAEADADIRSTLGIRDPLQDIPASQSGKAIGLQISQNNIGSFGFIDNLHSAIRRCAEIILDLIPHYYSRPQVLEIMGVDGQIQPTRINQPYRENNEDVFHDLTVGDYAVTLSTGPSYESRRTETTEKLVDLVAKYPAMMQVAGDLIVKNLDFEGASELADRLRAQIPPQILAASSPSNGDKASQQQVMANQLAQMSQAMQQASQQIQMLQAQLAQAQKENADKTADHLLKKLEIDTRLQIAKMQTSNKLDLAGLEAQTDAELLEQKATYGMIQSHADRAAGQHVEHIGNIGAV